MNIFEYADVSCTEATIPTGSHDTCGTMQGAEREHDHWLYQTKFKIV